MHGALFGEPGVLRIKKHAQQFDARVYIQTGIIAEKIDYTVLSAAALYLDCDGTVKVIVRGLVYI